MGRARAAPEGPGARPLHRLPRRRRRRPRRPCLPHCGGLRRARRGGPDVHRPPAPPGRRGHRPGPDRRRARRPRPGQAREGGGREGPGAGAEPGGQGPPRAPTRRPRRPGVPRRRPGPGAPGMDADRGQPRVPRQGRLPAAWAWPLRAGPDLGQRHHPRRQGLAPGAAQPRRQRPPRAAAGRVRARHGHRGRTRLADLSSLVPAGRRPPFRDAPPARLPALGG